MVFQWLAISIWAAAKRNLMNPHAKMFVSIIENRWAIAMFFQPSISALGNSFNKTVALHLAISG